MGRWAWWRRPPDPPDALRLPPLPGLDPAEHPPPPVPLTNQQAAEQIRGMVKDLQRRLDAGEIPAGQRELVERIVAHARGLLARLEGGEDLVGPALRRLVAELGRN
jgi:hypothetical protein